MAKAEKKAKTRRKPSLPEEGQVFEGEAGQESQDAEQVKKR